MNATWLLVLLAATSAMGDERLRARLDPETASQVLRIVERARADGLPTEPLVGQALQGAAKGIPGDRIVSAVRENAGALRDAKAALGNVSSESELVAGAGALLSGVPRDTLSRMRESRPSQSLVVPLVVLADLVARRVPADAAMTAVMSASRAGVRDADFMKLRERIDQDIRAGVSPVTAVETRARALLLRTGQANERARPPGPAPPSGAKRRTPEVGP
jgi:hypothetical protein